MVSIQISSGNVISTIVRHDDSKGKKDLAELTWEQREHVLRLLFSKMNSSGVI